MAGEQVGSQREGHCPECGPRRLSTVRGHAVDEYEDGSVWGRTDYFILKCQGCSTIYFQTDGVFSEYYGYTENSDGEYEMSLDHDIKYWPTPEIRSKPDWICDLHSINLEIFELLESIYTSINNNIFILSAIGVRCCFDKVVQHLGVDARLRFDQKIQALQEEGFVGRQEAEALNALTNSGSAAAHRGWHPNKHQLDAMMTILESFLHSVLVVPKKATELQKSVPQRSVKGKMKNTPHAAEGAPE